MGPDKLQYDSTGAGEMVKSHDGEIMGGFAKPAMLPNSGSGGPVPVSGHHDGSDVRTIEGAAGGPIGGFAKPGGAQDI